ncbi:glycoside hydrolase family 19 protein [Ruegeria jejuensis]|uniref:glycoside hydrolase family 19 protein n=1 Tax=Ruegeria jejuensis TaxID=3233338 RepID=UPI00355C1660
MELEERKVRLEETREKNSHEIKLMELEILKSEAASKSKSLEVDWGSKVSLAQISALSAVLGGVATIVVAYIGGAFSLKENEQAKAQALELKKQEFSLSLLETAFQEPDDRARARRLKFIVDVGLLDKLKPDEIRKYAEAEEERLDSGDTGPSLIPSNEGLVPISLPDTTLNVGKDDGFVAVLSSSSVIASKISKLLSEPEVIEKLGEFGALDSKDRFAALLAQSAHETGRFRSMVENLHYSGSGLWRIFRRHFASREDAESYARQPERIANKVYSNRLGNGSEESGDGWRYRGRGFLQLPGKSNYEVYGALIGIDLVAEPDLMAEPQVAILVAAAYMSRTKRSGRTLFEWADLGDVMMVTKGINGGTHGLTDRTVLFERAKAALNSGLFDEHPIVAEILRRQNN